MTTTGTPIWFSATTAVIAVLAVGVSIFSIWYTTKRADAREIERWQRDTATKAVNVLISKSLARLSLCQVPWYIEERPSFNRQERQKLSTLAQEIGYELIHIRICEMPSVRRAAHEIFAVHEMHEGYLEDYPVAESYGIENIEERDNVNSRTLEPLHDKLVDALQLALQIK